MKKLFNIMIMSVVVLFVASFSASACESCGCSGDKAVKKVSENKTINKVCPIMGKPVNRSINSEYDGKTIGFCCQGCKDTFDKSSDAEKKKTIDKIEKKSGSDAGLKKDVCLVCDNRDYLNHKKDLGSSPRI